MCINIKRMWQLREKNVSDSLDIQTKELQKDLLIYLRKMMI